MIRSPDGTMHSLTGASAWPLAGHQACAGVPLAAGPHGEGDHVEPAGHRAGDRHGADGVHGDAARRRRQRGGVR